MVNDRNGSFKGKSGCKHVQFIAGFYGAEVTTRARGGASRQSMGTYVHSLQYQIKSY